MVRNFRKPLIVASPKMLLRFPVSGKRCLEAFLLSSFYSAVFFFLNLIIVLNYRNIYLVLVGFAFLKLNQPINTHPPLSPFQE